MSNIELTEFAVQELKKTIYRRCISKYEKQESNKDPTESLKDNTPSTQISSYSGYFSQDYISNVSSKNL